MTVRVGFVGMTHLGLVSATAVCARGFETLCVDEDARLIARLEAGQLPVVEPGLDDMLAANGRRQKFSSRLEDVNSCDVVYIAADVPTDDAGKSDLDDIRTLVERVNGRLRNDAILVVLSQVPPGFTRSIPRDGDRLYYQVETLVFGQAVERASKPERYIVGCTDPAAPLDDRYRGLLEAFGCPILPMRYESAELAKISINMCLVSSISVANTMAELCAEVGADWHEIVPALRSDRRIGQYSYLKPGLGIAGGNLERDLRTVIDFAGRHATDARVVSAWLENNEHCREWAVRSLKRHVLDRQPDARIAVWGLAYKQDTASVKNSPSLATIRALPEIRFRVHDPAVSDDEIKNDNCERFDSAMEAAEQADALMILTPWPEYGKNDLKRLADTMAGTTVIDPYRMFEPADAMKAGLVSHTLGVASPGEAN